MKNNCRVRSPNAPFKGLIRDQALQSQDVGEPLYGLPMILAPFTNPAKGDYQKMGCVPIFSPH